MGRRRASLLTERRAYLSIGQGTQLWNAMFSASRDGGFFGSMAYRLQNLSGDTDLGALWVRCRLGEKPELVDAVLGALILGCSFEQAVEMLTTGYRWAP